MVNGQTRIPSIGDVITLDGARALCECYGFGDLITRIEQERRDFKPHWIFDGASMVPDHLLSRLAGIPHLTEIALRHDLKYAFGQPGAKSERLKADLEFKRELIEDGAPRFVAEVMYRMVRLLGDGPPRTSFTWGFARK